MTNLKNLNDDIVDLKNGKTIVWQFVDCKKELLEIFGGECSFNWNISNLTYIKLINPNQKLHI